MIAEILSVGTELLMGQIANTDAQYLFSPHDLCALPKLSELEEIGVHSLKVEGRLKSPEYVAAVSRAYRKALNGASLETKDLEPLEVLFSRGLTTGFLEGDNHQELVDGTFSNHHGLFLGTVVKVDRGNVIIGLEDKTIGISSNAATGFAYPQPGDGILFEDAAHEISVGSRLYKSQVTHLPHAKRGDPKLLRMEFGRDFDIRQIASGMKVYRNDSPALERELRKTFTEREQMKRMPVYMTLSGNIGGPLKLSVFDTPKNTVDIESDFILEESRNKNDDAGKALRELAQKELSALSATAYQLKDLEVRVENGAFVPGKILRTLRQNAIEKLDEKRCVWKPLKPSATSGRTFLEATRSKFKSSDTPAQPVISVLVRNPDQISALEGLSIDNVIMDFDWGVKYDEPLHP